MCDLIGLLHVVQSNSVAAILDEYRDRIIAEVDGVALRVGRLLREARQAAPTEFCRWVDRELPFGNETARRLIAISAAYEKLPAETLRSLPRPWQAMYALKELPPGRLKAGIASGVISPEMTVESAKKYARESRGQYTLHRNANKTAGRLMRASPSDLTTTVRNSLRVWLDSEN